MIWLYVGIRSRLFFRRKPIGLRAASRLVEPQLLDRGIDVCSGNIGPDPIQNGELGFQV